MFVLGGILELFYMKDIFKKISFIKLNIFPIISPSSGHKKIQKWYTRIYIYKIRL